MNQSPKNSLMYEKFKEALKPGVNIELDPNEACQVGAFIEDALNLDEASDSCFDSEDNM